MGLGYKSLLGVGREREKTREVICSGPQELYILLSCADAELAMDAVLRSQVIWLNVYRCVSLSGSHNIEFLPIYSPVNASASTLRPQAPSLTLDFLLAERRHFVRLVSFHSSEKDILTSLALFPNELGR